MEQMTVPLPSDDDLTWFEGASMMPLNIVPSNVLNEAEKSSDPNTSFSEGDFDGVHQAGVCGGPSGPTGQPIHEKRRSDSAQHVSRSAGNAISSQCLAGPTSPLNNGTTNCIAPDGSQRLGQLGASTSSSVSQGMALSPITEDGLTMPGIMNGLMSPSEVRRPTPAQESNASRKIGVRSNGIEKSGIEKRTTSSSAKDDQSSKGGNESGEKLTSAEIKAQRAKRNRESAKRSRLKSKMMQKEMSETFERLSEENKVLRLVVDKLLSSSNSVPPEIQERLRTILCTGPPSQ